MRDDFLLKIGTFRAKGITKNIPFLKEGGSTPAPHTQLGIRVVLLHIEGIPERIFEGNVCSTFSFL